MVILLPAASKTKHVPGNQQKAKQALEHTGISVTVDPQEEFDMDFYDEMVSTRKQKVLERL